MQQHNQPTYDAEKRERLRRYLFENRDREIQTTAIISETGVNRKAALQILPTLYREGKILFRDQRGKTLWRWRVHHTGPFENWMRNAKNRRPTQWMRSCSPVSLIL